MSMRVHRMMEEVVGAIMEDDAEKWSGIFNRGSVYTLLGRVVSAKLMKSIPNFMKMWRFMNAHGHVGEANSVELGSTMVSALPLTDPCLMVLSFNSYSRFRGASRFYVLIRTFEPVGDREIAPADVNEIQVHPYYFNTNTWLEENVAPEGTEAWIAHADIFCHGSEIGENTHRPNYDQVVESLNKGEPEFGGMFPIIRYEFRRNDEGYASMVEKFGNEDVYRTLYLEPSVSNTEYSVFDCSLADLESIFGNLDDLPDFLKTEEEDNDDE